MATATIGSSRGAALASSVSPPARPLSCRSCRARSSLREMYASGSRASSHCRRGSKSRPECSKRRALCVGPSSQLARSSFTSSMGGSLPCSRASSSQMASGSWRRRASAAVLRGGSGAGAGKVGNGSSGGTVVASSGDRSLSASSLRSEGAPVPVGSALVNAPASSS